MTASRVTPSAIASARASRKPALRPSPCWTASRAPPPGPAARRPASGEMTTTSSPVATAASRTWRSRRSATAARWAGSSTAASRVFGVLQAAVRDDDPGRHSRSLARERRPAGIGPGWRGRHRSASRWGPSPPRCPGPRPPGTSSASVSSRTYRSNQALVQAGHADRADLVAQRGQHPVGRPFSARPPRWG